MIEQVMGILNKSFECDRDWLCGTILVSYIEIVGSNNLFKNNFEFIEFNKTFRKNQLHP